MQMKFVLLLASTGSWPSSDSSLLQLCVCVYVSSDISWFQALSDSSTGLLVKVFLFSSRSLRFLTCLWATILAHDELEFETYHLASFSIVQDSSRVSCFVILIRRPSPTALGGYWGKSNQGSNYQPSSQKLTAPSHVPSTPLDKQPHARVSLLGTEKNSSPFSSRTCFHQCSSHGGRQTEECIWIHHMSVVMGTIIRSGY